MNISRICLSFLPKRFYAAQPKPSGTCLQSELKTDTLSNKIVVASYDSPVPGLCKVAVAVRAGSRYESHDNLGVSHVLRSSAGLSTKHATHFAISKNLQQIGATLSATSDRETIVYMLETTVDNLDCGLQYLKYSICGQEFRPWELSDNLPRLKYELAIVPPEVKVLDMIHKAAYRSELGNPLFAKKDRISKISAETLQQFVTCNFLSSRTSVAGIGVDHEVLKSFAEGLDYPTHEGETACSPYHGGEVRKEKNLPFVHSIIAAESCGLNKKDVFAFAVLRYALGAGSNVSSGIGCSPLSRVLGNSLGPVSARAISISHSDTGLFGVYIKCVPEDAVNAVPAVIKALKSGVTAEDINRGKAQLKSQLLFCAESADDLVHDIANQCALIKCARSPMQLSQEVESVTANQVKQALDKVVAGKKSMASLGNIFCVPYLSDIH
ncbi:hypothetical protein O3M35_011330 [Rhynocoris fuscipes]|uniref:Cytochrome b-c1 complex subunit 2, mitochondrial n=1 Tax=Rhynocoris fuscipes TaxID=488301 RepID=A0AAW1CW74_9HEMI